MEQKIKQNGALTATKSVRINGFYNTNRIRNFGTRRKVQQNYTSSTINRQHGYSLNKIDNAKINTKLELIKFKYFDNNNKSIGKSKLVQSPTKNNEDLQQANTSYDIEQQTDDTIIQRRDNTNILMRKSVFQGRPSTVHFLYPSVCGIQNKIQGSRKIFPLNKGTLKYKINGWQYKCIINTLEFNGFQPGEKSGDWNVYFDIRGNKSNKIQFMNPRQKISHFTGCWYIGRKDFLWRGINKIRRSFPAEYNFVPMTYLLPGDFDRFEFSRENSAKDKLWIMKPAASACGRGIKMIAQDTKIRNRKDYLISEYIANPHLINNLKYDLRVYVVVTSYDPLKIYLFQEGLVRFATYEYNCKHKDIKKRFVHLTNFSVNKYSKKFVKNQNADADNQGSKWSFKALRKYYESQGIDSQQLFARIQEVIIKTCVSAQPNMLDIFSKNHQKRNCCFQLYGFDILIDDKLKPWLMQVNVCPSLNSSSPMDRRIKHTLLVDIMNLIGVEYWNTKEQEREKKAVKNNFVQSSSKRLFSRNINNLQQLSYGNCLEVLSPQDWAILFESQQQLDRLGHFKRIFPQKTNIHLYENLFQFKRYNNIILWKYLRSSQNFLNRVIN